MLKLKWVQSTIIDNGWPHRMDDYWLLAKIIMSMLLICRDDNINESASIVIHGDPKDEECVYIRKQLR